MSRIVTIPLGKLPGIFRRLDFGPDDIVTILFSLIRVWKANDYRGDLTIEYIFSEMDLDPLAAQMLYLEAGNYMTEIGRQIRAFVVAGRLIKWDVSPYVILLEIEDANQVYEPFDNDSAYDGYRGNVGSVPLPF